ncbi:MAG: hypothetical protein ACT4QA_06285 [Panacagrimonas sp.]
MFTFNKKHSLALTILSAALLSQQSLAQVVSNCPPINPGTTNRIVNGSFESNAPSTLSVVSPPATASAAANWRPHTDNNGTPVTTQIVTTHAPGPNGNSMLRVMGGGVEGGVFQVISQAPAKVMLSAWVFVRTGRVILSPHEFATDGPAAYSSKTGQWEQLRVCSTGAPVGRMSIYNNAATGEFFVDRVEVVSVP